MSNESEHQGNPAPKRPLNVLLVEANPEDADLCVSVLKKAQMEFRVDVVKSPQEFAEHVRATTYDIVLSELLPGTVDWR